MSAPDAIPEWIQALERDAFGASWGPLSASERLFAEPELAFARFQVVPNAGEAELLRVATKPEARGRGVAMALLDRAEAALKSEGVEMLFLEVRASNASARRLYEKRGFAITGQRKGYYPDGETAVLYAKKLG